jgi:hypothetical protein
VLDTLTENEATFRRIMQGIHDFAKATTSAMFGLFLNFDLTTLFDPDALLSSLPGMTTPAKADKAAATNPAEAPESTPERRGTGEAASRLPGVVTGLVERLTKPLSLLGSR